MYPASSSTRSSDTAPSPLPAVTSMDYFEIIPLPTDNPHKLSDENLHSLASTSTNENVTPIGTPATEVPGGQIIISISTAFNSSSNHGDLPPDIILTSNDHVYFYVHRTRLHAASANNFNNLLTEGATHPHLTTITLQEDSVVLNILLHVIYSLSLRQYSPPLETLLEAIEALKKYGVPLGPHAARAMPLFNELVIKMPVMPMEVYALAAEHDLFDLAAEASSFLLSFPLSTLTDQMAARIGPLYLRRFFSLHVERLRVLQHLLARPPSEHQPTLDCGWTDYQRLKTAWSLACSGIVYDARADLSAERIRTILESLKVPLTCLDCKQSISQRVSEIVMKWSITPRTILRNTDGYRSLLHS
ncbi:hypothetical protein QCA50_011092 [Cerrena zonata]|uniref:BTB domain-containing protein n=1 Tax=Cerrena zonata TaxID=2478898 RepID=A0AAW0FXV0_9APHY